MEILGLDPKITICKIAVLPIKLYPLVHCAPYKLRYNKYYLSASITLHNVIAHYFLILFFIRLLKICPQSSDRLWNNPQEHNVLLCDFLYPLERSTNSIILLCNSLYSSTWFNKYALEPKFWSGDLGVYKVLWSFTGKYTLVCDAVNSNIYAIY